jgi:hypothetical protein
MIQLVKNSLWSQFGASIEMLENAIKCCPDKVWNDEKEFSWLAYHTLFFLDYYSSVNPVGFGPRWPFTYSEFGKDLPDGIFQKIDILNYLEFNRTKCHELIMNLTEQLIEKRWINESKTMNFSLLEILTYNMRHVQHHAAQLNKMLRHEINDAPRWVKRASAIG